MPVTQRLVFSAIQESPSLSMRPTDTHQRHRPNTECPCGRPAVRSWRRESGGSAQRPRRKSMPCWTHRATLACPAGVGMRWVTIVPARVADGKPCAGRGPGDPIHAGLPKRHNTKQRVCLGPGIELSLIGELNGTGGRFQHAPLFACLRRFRHVDRSQHSSPQGGRAELDLLSHSAALSRGAVLHAPGRAGRRRRRFDNALGDLLNGANPRLAALIGRAHPARA
jgi:hypothetical protein